MRSFPARVTGACFLKADVFEEVEHDEGATRQSAVLVLLVGVAAGVGSMGTLGSGLGGVVVGTLAGLAAWGAWAVLTFIVGTRLLPAQGTQADVGQLLRTLAFAASPGLFQVFAAVPGLRSIIVGLSMLWMLAAMVVAVRQALDYERTGRAVVVCLLAAALTFAMAVVLGVVFPRSVS